MPAVVESPEEIEAAHPEHQAALPRRSTMKMYVLTAATVMLNAFGNLFLALGMKQLPQTIGSDPLLYVRAVFHPLVAVGIAMLVSWLLTRMTLMSWADLSFVLPMTSIGYVAAAVLGTVFLHEHVSTQQWLGTLMIFGGASLVSTTAHKVQHQPGAPR